MEESLKFHIKVRVFHKERAFGPGVAELMHLVEETGSLSEACRRMEMAYSKGWKITKRAEEDLGFPLMEGSRGGSHGGKTTLTEKLLLYGGAINQKSFWKNMKNFWKK